MAGKINGMSGASQLQQVGASGTGQTSRNIPDQTGPASGSTSGSGAASTAADQVDITGAASGLATAEQSLSSVPVVNDSKVASIRSAIDAGTYKIQPQKIAGKLIDFEQSMPEAPGSDSSEAA